MFLQKTSQHFSIVLLFHRLYGVDAPDLTKPTRKPS